MSLSRLFANLNRKKENRSYYYSYLTELASTTYSLSKERTEFQNLVQKRKEYSSDLDVSETMDNLKNSIESKSSKVENLSFSLDSLEKNGEVSKYGPVIEEYVLDQQEIEYFDETKTTNKKYEEVKTK